MGFIRRAEGLVQAHGRLHQRTLRINYSEQLYGCVVLNTFLTFLDNRNVIWKNVMSTQFLTSQYPTTSQNLLAYYTL